MSVTNDLMCVSLQPDARARLIDARETSRDNTVKDAIGAALKVLLCFAESG